MISVSEVDKIIAENIRKFPIIEIPLEEAGGAILREDIKADRDLPPFHKALMDGIAVKYSAWKAGQRNFKIEGTQAAGVDALALRKESGCTEIMTGAVLSKGADCVIPVEYVRIEENIANIHDDIKLKRMLNIRPKGADHKEGDLLIKAGCIMRPVQIATAAAIGKAKIKVSYRPKIAVISTGDELVEINEDIMPFQIRKSNSYFIKAALDNTRLFETSVFHFRDNKKVLLRQISAIMEKFDVLIITGGISMGKFDFIPEVMKVLKVDVLFEKVKQKPGRPFWYGRTKRNQPIFALPGNPVSTQIGTVRHCIPNLKKALGLEKEEEEYAQLKESFQLDTPFTFFLPIRITCAKDGRLTATSVPGSGSGDFGSLAGADGFMEIPAETKVAEKGFTGKIYRF
ncbi:MAG TPA: molybdopterin molybdotransferase MoeA [Candidatus Omnitrophota bacterium]|nr:molybdopterin molybdotransferase MoeA [Candidatus Omnitrophota bacterium]